MGKEGEIFLGREICPNGRIRYGPTRYSVVHVCLPKGRKATNKCMGCTSELVIILYSKVTFLEFK